MVRSFGIKECWGCKWLGAFLIAEGVIAIYCWNYLANQSLVWALARFIRILIGIWLLKNA